MSNPFNRLLQKLLPKRFKQGGHAVPSKDYEPAGIIHYGSFTFLDYYAEATPHGTYHVWHHHEYLGEYSGQRIEIVEQLHARENQ